MTAFATPGRHLRAGAHEAQYSFCLRERSEVRALVTAPRVSICPDCAQRAEQAGVLVSESTTPYRGGGRACSFCGAGGRDDLIVAEHACICAPCVTLAMDVFREHAAARDPYDDRLDAELEALDE